MKPTVNFKSKIITQKDMEQGIWQFALDHSIAMGQMNRVLFGITTKEDLMRRIYARATMMYKIKDEDKIHEEFKKQLEQFYWRTRNDEKNLKRNKKIQQLPKYKRKIIEYLGRIRNKLIEKWI